MNVDLPTGVGEFARVLVDVTLRGEWPPLCSMTHDERRLA